MGLIVASKQNFFFWRESNSLPPPRPKKKEEKMNCTVKSLRVFEAPSIQINDALINNFKVCS